MMTDDVSLAIGHQTLEADVEALDGKIAARYAEIAQAGAETLRASGVLSRARWYLGNPGGHSDVTVLLMADEHDIGEGHSTLPGGAVLDVDDGVAYLTVPAPEISRVISEWDLHIDPDTSRLRDEAARLRVRAEWLLAVASVVERME